MLVRLGLAMLLLVAAAVPAAGLPGGPVAVPTATSSPLDESDVRHADEAVAAALGRLADWRAAQQAVTFSLVPVGSGFDVRLEALGDLDGDGRDEALLIETHEQGETFEEVATALRGPDLQQDVWRKTVTGESYHTFPDIDGDGIRDLMSTTGTGQFELTAQGVPAVPIGLYTFKGGFDFSADLFSGTGASLGTAVSEVTFDDTSVGGDATAAYGQAGAGTTKSTGWEFGPAGTLLQTEWTSTAAFGSASTSAGGFGLQGQDQDGRAVLRRHDGGVVAEFAVTGPERAPAGALALVDGAGARLVALWTEGAGAAQADLPLPVAPSRLHVTAVTGTTPAWDVAFDPAVYLEADALALPDLDGDGVGEAEVLLFTLDPTAPDFVLASTIVLSGGDGSEIARATGPLADLRGYLPFGDLEGDGTPELLFVAFGEDTESFTFGAAKADLSELWAAQTAGEPVNFQDDVDETSGLRDWSGDGAPDVALVEYAEDDSGLVRVLDGRSGQALWERALGNDQQLHLLGESSGTGAGDVLVATLAGVVESEDGPDDASGATASVEVLAGEDGRLLRRQVLRSPDGLAAGAAGVWLGATGVGDVDGDGLDEFSVSVTDLHLAAGDDGDEEVVPRGSVYVFSLRSEAPVLALAPDGNSSADLAPAPALPPPEGGVPADGEGQDQDAPGPAGLLVAAALALVAALRRRRA